MQKKTDNLVPVEKIEAAQKVLVELPKNEKRALSKREAVERLSPTIREAMSKGYSFDEISVFLKDIGIEVSGSTIKAYLPPKEKERKQTRRKAPQNGTNGSNDGTGGNGGMEQ